MKTQLIFLLSITFILSSCFDEREFDNTKEGNFEALWTIMDEHYCFFEYKNIDWNAIHDKYSVRIREGMTNEAFFDVMCSMLSEVQDGHVNLYASHDIGRYWSWKDDYEENFDSKVIYSDRYLGKDYRIASGVRYKILDDNVGYMYYSSFSSGIGDGNLTEAISHLSLCSGIIIDVRNNGGGNLSNVDKLVGRFINQKTHVGYIMHKTGKGHNDFSEPYARHIESYSGLRYLKPVVVLTNRGCYSATNDFVNAMKYAGATIIGDKTGGGSGLPFSSEMPNGWSVRFSASPLLNAEKQHIEFGIEPDIKAVYPDSDELWDSCDPVIETARVFLKK